MIINSPDASYWDILQIYKWTSDFSNKPNNCETNRSSLWGDQIPSNMKGVSYMCFAVYDATSHWSKKYVTFAWDGIIPQLLPVFYPKANTSLIYRRSDNRDSTNHDGAGKGWEKESPMLLTFYFLIIEKVPRAHNIELTNAESNSSTSGERKDVLLEEQRWLTNNGKRCFIWKILNYSKNGIFPIIFIIFHFNGLWLEW